MTSTIKRWVIVRGLLLFHVRRQWTFLWSKRYDVSWHGNLAFLIDNMVNLLFLPLTWCVGSSIPSIFSYSLNHLFLVTHHILIDMSHINTLVSYNNYKGVLILPIKITKFVMCIWKLNINAQLYMINQLSSSQICY